MQQAKHTKQQQKQGSGPEKQGDKPTPEPAPRSVGGSKRPADSIRVSHGGNSLPGGLFGGYPLRFQKTHAVV